MQRFKSIVKCIVRDMSDPFYLNISPGLAYYFLLSTAPVVLLFNYMVNKAVLQNDQLPFVVLENN